MIEKTIGEIEAKIRGADAVSEERKRELLQLLGTLKTEVGALSKTHDEQARKHRRLRAAFRARSHARASKIRNRCDHSLQGLRSSVEGFEKSHPQLVQIVNAISNTLSNLGI